MDKTVFFFIELFWFNEDHNVPLTELHEKVFHSEEEMLKYMKEMDLSDYVSATTYSVSSDGVVPVKEFDIISGELSELNE